MQTLTTKEVEFILTVLNMYKLDQNPNTKTGAKNIATIKQITNKLKY